MPKSLAKYGSEYQYLFDRIYTFHMAADKTDHDLLMMLPNAVRRFMELYTYSRIPGGYKETVDQRAVELFGKEKSKSHGHAVTPQARRQHHAATDPAEHVKSQKHILGKLGDHDIEPMTSMRTLRAISICDSTGKLGNSRSTIIRT